MKPLELDYFYGNDAEQFTFYRIPKVLFTDHRYKAVSVEAMSACWQSTPTTKS